MKAIPIARVSTEDQKEAGNLLPAQVVRLENYCQNRALPSLKVSALMKVLTKMIVLNTIYS